MGVDVDFHHIHLSCDERNYAAYHAQLLVKHSGERDQRPRLNGTYHEHLIGKLCELAFWKYCDYLRLPVLHTPFRPSYYEPDTHDDFIIEGRSRRIKIEVKGCRMRPCEIRRHDLFGIIYGNGQIKTVQENGNKPDIVVNVLTDGDLDTWITGFATWEMVVNGMESRHSRVPSRVVPITRQLPLKAIC